MGWTWHRATHYKNGKVDRKAECDAYFTEGLNRGHFEVLRSSVVGSVYYAAVKGLKQYAGTDPDGNRFMRIFRRRSKRYLPLYF